MKSPLIVHGCWFVGVVAAFALGSMRAKNSVPESQSGDPSQGGRTGFSIVETGTGNGTTSGNGGANEGSGLKGWSASAAERKPLTEAEIIELGRQIKTELDPIKKRLAFSKLLEGLTAENGLLMREQISSLGSRSAEFREFHYAWGAIGGVDAVMNGAETRERDMATTLAGWASADPAAALQWMNEIDEDKRFSNNELKMGLIHGLANNDPSTAADFVYSRAKLGDKQAEEMLNVVTGKMLSSVGAETAAGWAQNLPEGRLRASAMDRVAHDFVNKDPKAAAAWAEQFVGEEHSARVIEEVGDEWAERDPKSSVAWLETLESSEGKSQGIRSALGEWASRDPKAASQYLVDMPQSPERDYAISGFVGRLAWEDAPSAIQWADQISNEKARERTLISVGQAFLRKQPEAAKEWLPDSGLTPDAVAQVLKGSRRR